MEELLSEAFGATPVGLCLFGADENIVQHNTAFNRMSGIANVEAQTLLSIVTALGGVRQGDTNIPVSSRNWRTVIDAETILNVNLQRLDRGWALTLTESPADLGVNMALHDSMTGLPTGAQFIQVLVQSAATLREGRSIAVFAINIDRFKKVNASFGHLVGDRLLAEMARRLRDVTHQDAAIARLGGDTFLALCEVDEAEKEQQAYAFATSIRKAMAKPVHVRKQEFVLTVSIGIAVGGLGAKGRSLLELAERSLVESRPRGRGRISVARLIETQSELAPMRLEAEFRDAVADNDLILDYQPLVCMRTGRIRGFEALMRWRHPTRGIISPTDFIPLSEDTGLIQQIGGWAFEQAAKTLADWRRAGLDPDNRLFMSVNVSPLQLAAPQFADNCMRTIWKNDLAVGDVHVEITESLPVLQDFGSVKLLEKLKELGFDLTVDDFGTGFSSLTYIDNLPFSTIKIDRSFVTGIDIRPRARAIVEHVVALAHKMDIAVVVEGVETEEEADTIRQMDCDLAQGFLFYRPLTLAEATRELADILPKAAPIPVGKSA